MSTVEKAAEKLQARQGELQASARAQDEAPARHDGAPMVERLQERRQVDEAAVTSAVEALHVDEDRLKQIGLIPDDPDARVRLADELRRIKWPLLDNAAGKGVEGLTHARRIVVTSAVPGEGKTFTTLNLALSLASEPDFEVLLVDGDVPKADITRSLGLTGRPGLMELLVDESRRAADVIVPTDVPNLRVVPAGKRHPLTAELFGSRRMEYVLGELSGQARQRLVVFDSPPMLATSESRVLASQMGQVVVVVAAGRTRQQELRVVLENFTESQYVGLVLNMSRKPTGDSYYYGYYGNYHNSGKTETD